MLKCKYHWINIIEMCYFENPLNIGGYALFSEGFKLHHFKKTFLDHMHDTMQHTGMLIGQGSDLFHSHLIRFSSFHTKCWRMSFTIPINFFLTVFKSLDRKMIIWNSATWIFEFVIPRKIIIFDIKFLKLHNLNWLFSRSFKKGNSKYLNSDRWFSK